MNGWTLRIADASDRRELLRLEGELFGPESALRAEWLLDRNPAGPARVVIAVTADGKIAATRSLLPWDLRVDGDVIRVGQYTRTWTHPDHRNRGISVAIGNELNRCSAELNYPMVFLFPSDRSIPGHRRVGNRVDTLLERRQIVVSPRFFLPGAPAMCDAPLRWIRRGWGRRLGRTEPWGAEGDPPRAADRLWGRMPSAPGVEGVRDGRTVAWRFSPESGREYPCLRHPAGGEPRCLAFLHRIGNRVKIVDYWGAPDDGDLASPLAALVEYLAARGAWFVEYCPSRFGTKARAAARAGFAPRRRGVSFARWYNRPPETLGSLGDLRGWRLGEGDSDYA
jgi:Acetyltransferase (GNAT) domain